MINKKKLIIEKINKIKNEVESFIHDIDIEEVKGHVGTIIKDAKKEVLNKLEDKDLKAIKKKIEREKKVIEVKTKKFIQKQKSEIDQLHKSLDNILTELNSRISKIKVKSTSTPKTTVKIKTEPSIKKETVKKSAKKVAAKAPTKKPNVVTTRPKKEKAEKPSKGTTKKVSARKPTKRHK